MTHELSPAGIERGSMAIIREELRRRGLRVAPENEAALLRVIHATADFDFAETLRFSPGACAAGVEALRRGCPIVTDTNMARAGVSAAALEKLGGTCYCFMAEPEIAEAARAAGTTRAAASVRHAAARYPEALPAVGNAPTALLALAERIEEGLRPPLVIAAPVGFVNVVESKEKIVEVCMKYGVPVIAAMGRKGGSGVAAAICNALLYTATDQLDPATRG